MNEAAGAGPDGFRLGLAQGELRVPVCSACDAVLDYARRICTRCGSDAIGWRAASGHGRLRCLVEMSVSYSPVLPAPFLLASIELREGPHIIARYKSGMESEHAGGPVVAVIENGQLRFEAAEA